MSAATPPAAAQRRADALRRAAQAKRQTATARADAAIRQLVKNKQEINFRSVARTGGISIDFLYTSADLRHRIESLRTQQAAKGPFRPTQPETSDPEGSVIHILTTKLREERAARRTAEHDLQQRLAAAHGELLRLRRVMEQHGIQA